MPQLRHHHPQDPSRNIKPAANISFCEESGTEQLESQAAVDAGFTAGKSRALRGLVAHSEPSDHIVPAS